MNFSNDKAIYVQIAERLSDEILAGKYKEDERIPSVRVLYSIKMILNKYTLCENHQVNAHFFQFGQQFPITSCTHQQAGKGE